MTYLRSNQIIWFQLAGICHYPKFGDARKKAQNETIDTTAFRNRSKSLIESSALPSGISCYLKIHNIKEKSIELSHPCMCFRRQKPTCDQDLNVGLRRIYFSKRCQKRIFLIHTDIITKLRSWDQATKSLIPEDRSYRVNQTEAIEHIDQETQSPKTCWFSSQSNQPYGLRHLHQHFVETNSIEHKQGLATELARPSYLIVLNKAMKQNMPK